MEKRAAKRMGRPPKTAGDKKSVNLTFRTKANLRSLLEKSASESGRSLSEEMERRLEESFRRDSAEARWEQTNKLLDQSKKLLDETKRLHGEETDLIAEIEKDLRAGKSIDDVFGPPNALYRRKKK